PNRNAFIRRRQTCLWATSHKVSDNAMASVGGDVACYDRDDFGVGAPGRIRQRRVAHTCTLHKIGCPYLDSSDGCIRESDPLPPHLYRRDKAFTPHPSATHPQLLLLGNGK